MCVFHAGQLIFGILSGSTRRFDRLGRLVVFAESNSN
jgi:hypothetical protein